MEAEEEEQEASVSSKRKARVKRRSGESSKSKQKETVKEEPPSNDGEMEGSEEDKRKRCEARVSKEVVLLEHYCLCNTVEDAGVPGPLV